jgi:hypothetical protein
MIFSLDLQLRSASESASIIFFMRVWYFGFACVKF